VFSWVKKILSILFVLAVVALILNLNIGGRPARDRALEIWRSPGVQKVYRVIYDRLSALIHKDISVEDVFKPELPTKDHTSSNEQKSSPAGEAKEENKVIHLEKLDEQDRKALEKILEKSSK
jgi:hypothetical protein